MQRFNVSASTVAQSAMPADAEFRWNRRQLVCLLFSSRNFFVTDIVRLHRCLYSLCINRTYRVVSFATGIEHLF
jgi:hypothetical protein